MKKSLQITLFTILFSTLVGLYAPEANAQNQKIGVIADIHYFDPDLLINDGSAFQTYLAYDRKLLQESEAILESVVDSLIAQNLDAVIVAGDLTKDGEESGHQKVASYFQQLEDAGIEVIVTPGNHDINNPHAWSFDGDTAMPVPSVSPEDFATIYNNYGFNEATATDTASLSFVYHLTDSLTVISMDVCRYDSNYVDQYPTTSGGFKPEVLDWVISQITAARATGRTVFGVMHHGIVEHYMGQKDLFPEYVIDQWDSVSTILAEAGMNIVFTGHYHAQDMVMKTTDESFIFDIETGSTVTYPSPYRILEYDGNTLAIQGKRIQEVDYNTGDLTFQQYALDFLENGLPALVKGMLMSEPYNLPDSTATMIEPSITESFIAHYSGDEGTPSAQTQQTMQMLLEDPNYQAIGFAMQSIWNDPNPSDWNIEIDMSTGAATGFAKTLINQPISIYPNPSQGTFTLSGEFKGKTTARIYNLAGQVIFSTQLKNGDNQLSTNLKTGIFIVEIQSGNVKLSKKLIIR